MALWINRAVFNMPRNGTTSHTCTPSSATNLFAGSAFTPTASNLLVCYTYAGVTSTTPTGWTLPTNGAAINNGGLYVWWRSAAGSDTWSTTHNVTNYPCMFEVLEFASGSTFQSAAQVGGIASGAAGPSLTMAAGTKTIIGAVGLDLIPAQANTAASVTWGTGTELTDDFVIQATTDGYLYSSAYIDASTATAQTMAATYTTTPAYGGTGAERLMTSIVVTGGVAATRIPDVNMAWR